jgi:beta-N-acetylhexosaminidase
MSGASLSVPDGSVSDGTGPEAGRHPAAVVFGCAGPALTVDEREFFRSVDPLGFILFRRNCHSPDQVRTLVSDLRAAVGRIDAPVLIDQEGGRVARLRSPVWPDHPPARRFGDLALGDPDTAAEAVWLNARLLAAMLHDLGITVDCAPVCDVPSNGAHDVIGDRAFSDDPDIVAGLARVFCIGLMDGGVLPVIKHLPGHGRALADSHLELPVVDTGRADLARSDFVPFQVASDMPLGMVAHVVYTEIDPDHPASTSLMVIHEVIRGALEFDGLLFCDDLSMNALAGSMGDRAQAVLAAGCDVVLHCNGDMAEMRDIATVIAPLTPEAASRWDRARTRLRKPDPIDTAALRTRLDGLLDGSELVA